uniref:RRM domain-containing protein n=1 Tax=Arcella intermedia TaxID=1963864 RepID=A0A6B2LTC5_9EUKA
MDRFEPYVPLKAGSIDGTDHRPHDRAVVRATNASYDASLDKKVVGDPRKTLFVARLNHKTTEETLRNIFEQYGPIDHFRLVRDIVTGHSRGYAFMTYNKSADFKKAWKV